MTRSTRRLLLSCLKDTLLLLAKALSFLLSLLLLAFVYHAVLALH